MKLTRAERKRRREAEKTHQKALRAIKKEIKQWRAIRDAALLSQSGNGIQQPDVATAARCQSKLDDLNARLTELKAPANVPTKKTLPLNQEIISRLRQLYGLPLQGDLPQVRVVWDPQDEGMSDADDAERMVSTAFSLILIGEAGRIDELAAEVERQLLQRRKNEPRRLVGQIAAANAEAEIRTARERANAGSTEPGEGGDDGPAGRESGLRLRSKRTGESVREDDRAEGQ